MLTTQALNKFDIQNLDLLLVPEAAQTGFFHPASIPILGLLITRMEVNPVCLD